MWWEKCTNNREEQSLERIAKQSQFKNVAALLKERTEAGVNASKSKLLEVQ